MAGIHHMSHDHPLVFNKDTSSPSDTTYNCAACEEKVLGSSYSCGECGFYLHENCALPWSSSQKHLDQWRGEEQRKNMVGIHHKSHEHPLVFNEDTSSPSDTTYDCAACAEKVLGSSYSCGECRFYLHKKCAEAPSEIHHPAHRDHPLLLHLPDSEHREREVGCRICRKEVKGFIYECSCYEFYLDFNCALLPRDAAGNLIETLHVAHPHPLISINPTESLLCRGCWGKLTAASYACFDCGVFFHKKCLELPTEIDHPCHRKHQLLLVFSASSQDFPSCNLCQRIVLVFFYRCLPCSFIIHAECAWPPPIIEDKSHHPHPFTLLLRPNNPFHCDACGNQGNHVSYTCSPCNIQVHKDCVSLPRHIRLNLHPHPISHHFFLRIDRNDSRTWDCRICYKNVNIEHGSYCCSRPGCDFVIHVKCCIHYEIAWLYNVVGVENPDKLEESDWSYEPKSCIIRIIKEIKAGDDVIAGEIEHVSHEHNLVFSEEIKDDKYCNACVLPVLSSFYYCSHCDFFLHKACAELPRMFRLWLAKPFRLLTDGVFECQFCHYKYNGFSYKFDLGGWYCCLRCASVSHSFTYQADEPHFLFFDYSHQGDCNACGEVLSFGLQFRCKDCTFALHYRCVTLPRTARHKCDEHPLTLAYQDPDDYPLHHYCDICEKERDTQQWFYRCETCDNAMHLECVIGRYQYIKAGSKYTHEDHPHPLTFVKNIYYYPECVLCGKPCQDLALECAEHGCNYIVHWTCIKPLDSSSE